MPRLLCVGRLIPIKGHIVLLRAFAEAKRELPELQLDIAGRGPLEPALKALARELGIADSVHFLGHVTPIQARDRAGRRSSSCPSMGEGFGMVALEAMERARPVIAAAIGGLGELVRDGETGVLVPAGEAEPLRDAIVRARRRPRARAADGRGGTPACALALPAAVLHRAHRAAVRRRARERRRDVDDEVRSCSLHVPPLYRVAHAFKDWRYERTHEPMRQKHGLLRDAARRHGLRVLVETGTYTGETAWALRREFDRIDTIELEPRLAHLARIRFARTPIGPPA